MIQARIRKNKGVFVILLAIILLGMILRLYGLGAKSIWYDEAVSIANAEKDLTCSLDSYFSYRPVYFILLKLWMNLFGAGEITNRFLSVIFGVISIFLIYKIGKMLFNNEVGLISAFILAISCFHIYHSQQVRQHSFLTFLTLLSFIFFLRIITKPSSRYFIYNSLTNIFILGTHPYGLCVIFVQNLFFFFKVTDKISKRKWCLWQLAILCCSLWILIPNRAWIIDMIWQIPKPGFDTLMETFETFSFGGPGYGIIALRMSPKLLQVPKYLLFVYNAFFVLGVSSYKNKTIRLSNSLSLNDGITFLIYWLIVPIGLAFLCSIIYKPVYLIKHLIIASPAYYILIARGIYQVKTRWKKISILALVSFLSICPLRIMYGVDYYPHWNEAAGYLRKNIQEGDVIIISTLKEILPFMYYFKDDRAGALLDFSMYGKIEQGRYQALFSEGMNIIIGIDEIRNKDINFGLTDFEKNFRKKVINQDFFRENRNIWLLVSSWTGEREAELMEKCMQEYRFKVKSKKHYLGIDVYKYSPRS